MTATTHPFWLGTSWKMTKTLAEALAYAEELRAATLPPPLRVFVLPPATALAAVRQQLGPGSPILLGAQNAYPDPEGAVTGEVSMAMVRDAGASLVEIGHAERRTLFGETDSLVAAKAVSAVSAGLVPLVCVGENQEQRRRGEAAAVVAGQVRSAVEALRGHDVRDVLVAYEPHWAIGWQGLAATPDQVAPVLDAIRWELAGVATGDVGVLYGGSVHPDNVHDLVADLDIDGLFVGRAAWTFAGLRDLAERCAEALAQRSAIGGHDSMTRNRRKVR